MLYDPSAVKRLASAVCVLPPTPRSRSGTSGCQGCESSSTTASSREPGLDAGAPGRLYCVPSQEEEQQRPVVGHGIVLGEWPSQENLAKGKGRAWGDARSSTEPFRKKDHATYLGAQRQWGVWGALPTSSVAYDRADCQPRTSRGQSRRCLGLSTACTDRSGDCGVGRTCRHEPALCPCGRSACHAPGSHPPASVWLFRTSNRARRCGETPPLPEAAQGGAGATPRRRQGGEAALDRQERQRSAKPPGGARGEPVARRTPPR